MWSFGRKLCFASFPLSAKRGGRSWSWCGRMRYLRAHVISKRMGSQHRKSKMYFTVQFGFSFDSLKRLALDNGINHRFMCAKTPGMFRLPHLCPSHLHRTSNLRKRACACSIFLS